MPDSSLPISDVAPQNNRRKTLLAIRDRLASETDDTRWADHKRECHCVCGIGDGRLLVALVKELRAVEAELAALPASEGGHPIDAIEASVASLDQHRRRRASRRPAAAGS